MELRQLRYFLAIAEARTQSAAAEKLHIAQPALTQNIKSLEQELGTQLFLRSSKGMELTDTGRLFLGHAQMILRQVANAKNSVQDAETNPHGDVALAIPSSVANVLTTPLFKTLREEFPNINIGLTEGLSGDIAHRFRQGLADILIDFNFGESSEFDVQHLLRESLYFIEAYPAKTTEPISFTELANFPLYLPRATSDSMHTTLNRYAKTENLQLNILSGTPTMHAMIKLVESGMGCSVLPWSAIYDLVGHRLSARKIISPDITRTVCVITDFTRTPSNASTKVVGVICRSVREMHAKGLWHGELL